MLTIAVEGDQRFYELAAIAPDAAETAMRRAITKVRRSLASRMAREQAAAHGFPVRPLRTVRTRGKGFGPNEAGVWFGYNPIQARYVGRKADMSGAPGAFLATMPSGHVGWFKRVGKARFPIVELDEELPMPSAIGVAEGLATAFGLQAETVIAHEFEFILLHQ